MSPTDCTSALFDKAAVFSAGPADEDDDAVDVGHLALDAMPAPPWPEAVADREAFAEKIRAKRAAARVPFPPVSYPPLVAALEAIEASAEKLCGFDLDHAIADEFRDDDLEARHDAWAGDRKRHLQVCIDMLYLPAPSPAIAIQKVASYFATETCQMDEFGQPFGSGLCHEVVAEAYQSLFRDMHAFAITEGADAELVALGERHAQLDARILTFIGDHKGFVDAAYAAALNPLNHGQQVAIDRSYQFRATTVAGLRAKALIASAWMPGEATEEYDDLNWKVAWSLVRDALAIGDPAPHPIVSHGVV